jgi:hypothetical protein
MVICNDKRDVVVFTTTMSEINIHTNRKKIVVSFNPALPPLTIGSYSTSGNADRAFGWLVKALEDGKDFFQMPNDNEVSANLQGGALSKAGHRRTTGKTK